MELEKCRTCLKTGSMSNIFQKLNSVKISTKIMEIAKIQIERGDGLPHSICSKCLKTLKICWKFITLCKNSDSKLRSHTTNEDNIVQDLSYKSCCDEKEACGDITENITADVTNNHNKISECENVFDTLKSNKRRKARKVQCSTCGKVMSSSFRLKTHLRTHTGEKPFPCPHCCKTFSLAQNLKVHIRTHTGEKPLSCNVCGKTFAQAACLITHKRKHSGETPYQCELCPRTFRTAGHLLYHVRSHRGEKNFACHSCDHTFITRSDLKKHLIVHSGERPHVCSICGIGVARASYLKRHMAMHASKRSKCDSKYVDAKQNNVVNSIERDDSKMLT